MTDEVRDFWDSIADAFDDEADHGLLDPHVRAAWRELLLRTLPAVPADVADLGCGTGSLSVLLAEAGYRVRGVDLADRMVGLARAKAAAAGVDVEFAVGDAADPPYEPGSVDVVLVRHVLWALPDPDAALAGWVRLLRPNGRLVLVEGSWSTGAGLTAADCEALVRRHREQVDVRLLPESVYWGHEIDDERYLLVSVA